MATKKAARKSTKTGSKKVAKRGVKGPLHPNQVDEPIIIKGGSLVIEMDKNFRSPHTPSHPRKKGHKHPDATRITYVVLLDRSGNEKDRMTATDRYDQVMVCYENPVNGCGCI